MTTFTTSFRSIKHTLGTYITIGMMVPKMMMAYSIWFWMQLLVQVMAMIIFVYFWRAVYASHTAAGEGNLIGGMTLQQTIDYILMAQILFPAVLTGIIFDFGWLLREGRFAMELLRPIDYQLRTYFEQLVGMVTNLLLKVPLLLLAVLFLGLRLPLDPRVWVVFIISLFLGHAVMFFCQWLFATIAFYTTETWGLQMVFESVMSLFSGALIPLMMLPGWLQTVGAFMPFAQSISVPVSFLSGVTPVTEAPRVWLIQLLWIAGIFTASRLFFNHAMKKITVQGG